ncbi:hypothetical protein NE237_028706 [Protea cynaroides]|uniref:Uncharacterized protein n=1 Tax=Protea cynaroides TaxID=273540 RepID=A0A9Q0JT48_9MAGN|nr:hypothetical protein NE237_028706 [Protea cynaroides]
MQCDCPRVARIPFPDVGYVTGAARDELVAWITTDLIRVRIVLHQIAISSLLVLFYSPEFYSSPIGDRGIGRLGQVEGQRHHLCLSALETERATLVKDKAALVKEKAKLERLKESVRKADETKKRETEWEKKVVYPQKKHAKYAKMTLDLELKVKVAKQNHRELDLSIPGKTEEP